MPVPLLLLPPFLVVLPVIGMNHHQIAIANRCAMMTGNPNYGFTPKVHSLSSSGLEMDGDVDFKGGPGTFKQRERFARKLHFSLNFKYK